MASASWSYFCEQTSYVMDHACLLGNSTVLITCLLHVTINNITIALLQDNLKRRKNKQTVTIN